MKRTRNLKLPNGFGSIVYLGDNRRRPYAALKTVGWNEKGKQVKKYIGYETSYNKAYQLLLEYNGNPFDLDYKNITLGECYDKLVISLEKDYLSDNISKSTFSCLKSTYNNQLYILKNKEILSIRKKDIQTIIDNSNLKYTGRNYIKILFTRIIKYCNDELNLNINESIYKDLKIGDKEKSTLHFPFSSDEIKQIKELALYNDTAKMIMIYLFTGLRPSELLEIKIENVFISDNYMIGGIKTEAGIDRKIPIHHEIKPYIEYFYNQKNKYLIMRENTKMSYDVYQKRFLKLMEDLNFKHTPHDTRHTFATRCDTVGIPLPLTKLIMGHSQANDITSNVYIHVSIEKLLSYIEKIEY